MSRKLLLPAALALALFAALVSLGLWQLNRKAWKEALIARVEARAGAPPVPLAGIPVEWLGRGDGMSDGEFARLRARGVFRHDRELHLLSPQRMGAAWMIVTRFDTAQGPVLVMRGVVPEALKDAAKRAAGQVEGEIEIVGRIRSGETAGLFSAANDVARNVWFSRDLDAMRRAAGMDETGRALPFFIELESPLPPGGLPRPQPDAINLRNDHLQYALTWFSLAGVLVAMFGFWLWTQTRPGASR